jgi:hypothetical protein
MRSEWIIGLAVIGTTTIAGVISFDYVNRRFPATPAPAEQAAAQDAPRSAEKQTVEKSANPAPVTLPAPCVETDGSWRHWSWPNVPMLSPKCEGAK